jgi:hypothetical protein
VERSRSSCFTPAICNVPENGVVEEHSVLWDHSNTTPQRSLAKLPKAAHIGIRHLYRWCIVLSPATAGGKQGEDLHPCTPCMGARHRSLLYLTSMPLSVMLPEVTSYNRTISRSSVDFPAEADAPLDRDICTR